MKRHIVKVAPYLQELKVQNNMTTSNSPTLWALICWQFQLMLTIDQNVG